MEQQRQAERDQEEVENIQIDEDKKQLLEARMSGSEQTTAAITA